MSRRRLALAFALFIAFALCTVFAVLRVIAPPPAPATVQPGKPLTPRLAHQLPLLVALVVCFVARVLGLSLMFFVAGNSYWTALRVLGDLPNALAMSLGALLTLATLAFQLRPSPKSTPA